MENKIIETNELSVNREYFMLFEQKVILMLDNISINFGKLSDKIYGNGKTGLEEKVQKLEYEIEYIKKSFQEIIIKLNDMQKNNEKIKWQITRALIYLSAGGSGVAAIIKFFWG